MNRSFTLLICLFGYLGLYAQEYPFVPKGLKLLPAEELYKKPPPTQVDLVFNEDGTKATLQEALNLFMSGSHIPQMYVDDQGVYKVLVIKSIETAKNKTSELGVSFIKKGIGSPVVLFESGLGETLGGWKTIQDSISKITTTISYDRIGLGKSSATENPRTLENLVSELNDFLENEEIDGPLVLVGHSLGGFIIRKFQNAYPEKVVGLVFVDPSHESLMERIFATKTEEEVTMMTKQMDEFYASQPIGIQNEYKEVSKMDNEMKELKLPTKIPVTILASYQTPPPPFSPDDIKIKKELYNHWVESTPQAKLIGTTKSGHYIHYSEPNLVINEIKKLLSAIED